MADFKPYCIPVTTEHVAKGIEALIAGLENWELSEPFPSPVSYDLPVRYITPTREAREENFRSHFSQHPEGRGPRPSVEFK